MLTYDLDKRGNKTMYEYLYELIKEDISDGKLKADEKSVLDLTQYNKLLASYQEYLDSLNSAIDTVDNITNNSYNYLGVAIVALTTTLAAAVLVITKKY